MIIYHIFDGVGYSSKVFMNDAQESPLVTSIREAAYSEIDHIFDLYARTEDISDCLPLMHPDSLRQIVINAGQKLSEVCLEACEEIYEEFIEENPSTQVSTLRPSFRMMKNVKHSILGNTAFLESEINHYQSCYELFIQEVGEYEEKYSDNAHNAETMGSIIGAVLFGKIGELVGGMAAGAIAGGLPENELDDEIQELCANFSEIVSKVEDHLQDMAERSIQLIISYSERLEHCQSGQKFIS